MTEYERGVWAAIRAMQKWIGPSDYAYNLTDEILRELGLNNDTYDDEEDE